MWYSTIQYRSSPHPQPRINSGKRGAPSDPQPGGNLQQMATEEPASRITDSPAVRAWVAGLREHWGEEPRDMAGRIEMLAQFCAFVAREPDGIIEECSREV